MTTGSVDGIGDIGGLTSGLAVSVFGSTFNWSGLEDGDGSVAGGGFCSSVSGMVADDGGKDTE